MLPAHLVRRHTRWLCKTDIGTLRLIMPIVYQGKIQGNLEKNSEIIFLNAGMIQTYCSKTAVLKVTSSQST